ncbi:MAG: hypothetical protein U1E76_09310 [Planctomycetota bacterium]
MNSPVFASSMEILLDGRRGRIRRVADQALVVRFDGDRFDRWVFRDTVEMLWNQGEVRLGPRLPFGKRLLWRVGLWRDARAEASERAA